MADRISIREAALRCDWTECARAMFLWLAQCNSLQQKIIAQHMLQRWHEVPNDIVARAHPTPFELRNSENDAASAEFQNAVLEFNDGARSQSKQDSLKHYATAIRSVVLAKQIRAWIEENPSSYNKWVNGEDFEGFTFLEFPQAIRAAQTEWLVVERYLSLFVQPADFLANNEYRASLQLYEDWKDTLL